MTPRHDISPTQASIFEDTCQRKWGIQYLDGVRPPQAPSARVGDAVHKVLEDWLKLGKPPDHYAALTINGKTWYPGRIAYEGLHLLPAPSSNLIVEHKFKFGRWNGRIDLAYHDPAEGVHVISDHKTSTDPKAWGKTPEDLEHDVQAIVYAKAGLLGSGADKIDLRWTYFQTREPYKAFVVKKRLPLAHVDEMFGHWDEVAKTILTLRNTPGLRGADLPPNTNSCSAFGGCPFRGTYCQISAAEQIGGLFMQSQTMADRVKAMKAAKERGEVVNAATPGALAALPPRPPEPPPPPPPATKRAAAETDIEAVRQAFMVGQSVAQMSDGLGILEDHVQQIVKHFSAQWVPEQRAGRVNPPEEPTTIVAQPGEQVEDDDKGKDESIVGDEFDAMNLEQLRQYAKDHALPVDLGKRKTKATRSLVRSAWKDRQKAIELGEAPPSAEAVAQVEAARKAAAEAVAAARAAQTPAEGSGTPVAQPPPPPPPPPLPAAVQAPQPAVPIQLSLAQSGTVQPGNGFAFQTVPSPSIESAVMSIATNRAMTEAQEAADKAGDPVPTFALFIDCLPRRSTRRTMTVREAFPEAFEHVENMRKVPDYRLVDFGKGPPEVAATIAHSQQQMPLAEDVAIVISSRSAEGQHFIEVLAELADEVVQGVG